MAKLAALFIIKKNFNIFINLLDQVLEINDSKIFNSKKFLYLKIINS